MDPNTQRAEAERWLGIAAKLLTARDFLGSKTFAIRARESDPNNAVSDQILAVVDTVLAGEKRVNTTQQPDWYAVLQLPRLVRDPELIANHYRRLVLLLNPEQNRLPFADYALQLAMDAWSVLSDPTKKWLFDNELALSLQRADPGPVRVDPVRVDSVAGGSQPPQVNTFQFFQPQPQQQPPPQPMVPPMWQHQHQQQQSQIEFMPPPQPQPQLQPPPAHPPPPPPQQEQLPPQWQMRDPTPVKGGGGGERNKGLGDGGGGGGGGRTTTPTSIQSTVTPSFIARPPPVPAIATPATTREIPGRGTTTTAAAVAATTVVNDNNDNNNNGGGNASNVNVNNNVNDDNGVSVAAVAGDGVNENNENGVEEDVECFWTACPYCFYIYEYQKVYQDCTLRCQNCRRGFHAVQIPNPPPITGGSSPRSGGGGGGGKEKEKDKDSSFCCWGFFPLGFSMTAWKKYNQNVSSSNWVPFSPMFASPGGNGGGNFQWFTNSGNAGVGPKNVGYGGVGNASTRRVYIDDDDDYIEASDPSDSDSSDRDWRNPNKDKKKKRRSGKRGRPRKVHREIQKIARGGGVSVGGEDMEDGSDTQEVVVGLVAGAGNGAGAGARAKADVSRNVNPNVMRKQTRRSLKDMGRLDLNVEFNNEGEEHAPPVSAVHGEEDGMESIGFFEGLDEFLSTLPILNVGDEKAKPS